MKEIVIRKRAGFAWQMPYSRGELREILRAMRSACGLDGVFLDVTLADDAFIADANEAYLACPGPTNILSFPAHPGAVSNPGLCPPQRFPKAALAAREAEQGGLCPPQRLLKGILLLSLDAVNREALLYGQDVAGYALRLFSHGMAHLTGLDHGPEMERLEEKALAAGRSVFSPAPPA